ncbi:LmbE protein [Acinetobacter baumannii ABNIH11]|nr:LmbE protein [Acinetobacter baumannii ABNIH11]
MGTLKHPLVEDRMISGEGTPEFMWLEAFKKSFRSAEFKVVSV